MNIYEKLTDPNRFAKPLLDSCGKGKKKDDKAMLDGVADYAIADLKLKAAASVQQWADSDVPLGEGETQSDRLFALLVGTIDANKNGEIDDDEADAFDIVANFSFDYLTRNGIAEDDASALLNDWDNDTAERIRDLLIESLPDDDAAGDDMDSFVFDKANGVGKDENEDGIYDAVYKKSTVIRAGKKVRMNKRISGSVHLSGAQKAAIRKAQRKSHSAGAMMKRAKSMRIRVKTGLQK